MADLLSASSLLMAVVAILYSLWYPELTKALELTPKAHKEDNVGACGTVKVVLFSRALPLAIMAFMVALIFLPDALRIVVESISTYRADGLLAVYKYDAVKAAYCFVFLLSVALSTYVIAVAVRLWSLWARLK